MSIFKGIALRYLLLPLWGTTTGILEDMWSRSSSRRYQVAPRHWTRSLKLTLLWRLFFYAYLLSIDLRFILGVYLRSFPGGEQSAILKYDVNTYVQLYIAKTINFMSVILTTPLYLFVIYFDYLISLKQFNNLISISYGHMIVDPAHFWTLNPNLKPKLDYTKPRASLCEVVRLLGYIWAPPKELKMAQFQMKKSSFLPPDATRKDRAQVVLFTLTLQALFAYFQGLLVMLTLTFTSFYYVFVIVPQVSQPAGYLLPLLDLLLIGYTVTRMGRILFFIAHICSVTQFGASLRLRQSQRLLTIWRGLFTQGRLPLAHFTRQCTFFQAIQTLATDKVAQMNQYIISGGLFMAVASQTSTNVYVVSSLAYVDFPIAERGMFLFLLMVQALLGLLIIRPMVLFTNQLNSSHAQLYGTVPLLLTRKGQLSLKLKMAHFYERSNTVNPVTFTCGPLGPVTSETALQFTAFYVSQLLFTMDLFGEQFERLYANVR